MLLHISGCRESTCPCTTIIRHCCHVVNHRCGPDRGCERCSAICGAHAEFAKEEIENFSLAETALLTVGSNKRARDEEDATYRHVDPGGAAAAAAAVPLLEKQIAICQETERGGGRTFSESPPCTVCNLELAYRDMVLSCSEQSSDKCFNRGGVIYRTTYRCDRSGSSITCEECFKKMKSLDKDQLLTLKKDSTGHCQLETMVQCTRCSEFFHAVCGMVPPSAALVQGAPRDAVCPPCITQLVSANTRFRGPSQPKAADLQQCELSDQMEAALSPDFSGVCVRVVNDEDKFFSLPHHLATNPQQQQEAYRQKVILAFQEQDGVDVCLFCVYVHEYGDECYEPNRRRVYLSYLDSVRHFRPGTTPTATRTHMFNKIVLEYMVYAKARGFRAMHIWSCPPKQALEYIFYCCKEWKGKTSDPTKRLRKWYERIFDMAVKAGIATRWETLKKFMDNKENAMLPYFEGDLLQNKLESIPPENTVDAVLKKVISDPNMYVVHFDESTQQPRRPPLQQPCPRGKLFSDRVKFVGWCAEHNYQFNTERHARYSSMVVLGELVKEMQQS